MTKILDEIVTHKRVEIAARQALTGINELLQQCAARPRPSSLSAALNAAWPGVIAEIKRRSPSRAAFKAGLDVIAQACSYEQGGAAAISVLTDARFFGMQPQELTRVKAAVGRPVLRKEFIIDPYQVYETRALGADALLLIARILDGPELAKLYHLSTELGMEVLLEVHCEADLQRALELGAPLVGINSRDLGSFNTDIGIVEDLARLVQRAAAGITLVAESGMREGADLARLRGVGVQGFLIGESLLSSADPRAKLTSMKNEALCQVRIAEAAGAGR
jgi:indole-3-glycerol phosphate synthase